MIRTQRQIELGSRVVLLASLFPPAWFVGTVGLSIAKILENMEIGHNILHGQWDWMRDPKIHSTTWEWDSATPAAQWQHSHNELHHTYTNVIGKDNDLGYGIMRVDEDQPWHPMHLGQPLWNLINATLLRVRHRRLRPRAPRQPQARQAEEREVPPRGQGGAEQDQEAGHQGLRRPPAAVGAVVPHHPDREPDRQHRAQPLGALGDHVRPLPRGRPDLRASLDRGRDEGEWYVRQMLGSANISGSKLMHIMTGNLSHQIEHHLFPDLPSNRYGEIAPRVQALFERYDLDYCARPLPQQVYSAWHKVVRLSLPNGWLDGTTVRNLPSQLQRLYQMTTGGPKVRRALQARMLQENRRATEATLAA